MKYVEIFFELCNVSVKDSVKLQSKLKSLPADSHTFSSSLTNTAEPKPNKALSRHKGNNEFASFSFKAINTRLREKHSLILPRINASPDSRRKRRPRPNQNVRKRQDDSIVPTT